MANLKHDLLRAAGLAPCQLLKTAMLTFLGCHVLQVTLVYHRPLDAAWEEAAKGLRKYFAQVGHDAAGRIGTSHVHQPPWTSFSDALKHVLPCQRDL